MTRTESVTDRLGREEHESTFMPEATSRLGKRV